MTADEAMQADPPFPSGDCPYPEQKWLPGSRYCNADVRTVAAIQIAAGLCAEANDYLNAKREIPELAINITDELLRQLEA